MIEKHLPVEKKIAVSLMQAAELIGVSYPVIKDWVDNDKKLTPVFF